MSDPINYFLKHKMATAGARRIEVASLLNYYNRKDYYFLVYGLSRFLFMMYSNNQSYLFHTFYITAGCPPTGKSQI